MLYKYLFYFCAYFEKKYDRFGGDPYISSYIIVGLTIAANIFVILDVVCILFAQNDVVGELIINSMLIFCIGTIILSYLYFNVKKDAMKYMKKSINLQNVKKNLSMEYIVFFIS
jgi:hypothetical protein